MTPSVVYFELMTFRVNGNFNMEPKKINVERGTGVLQEIC